jgi:chromosome segregation ATPase
MQKVHTLPQEWKIVNAIVYKDTPSCEYHYTNNTSANGIVPVDALKPIFPNLALKSFELSNSISIVTLLEQTKATQVNWLMVDCYTQMSFFEENKAILESFDVIVVRLLRDEKQTLDAWMNEQGLRSVEAYEESNPQVLMVVYLKDFSGRLELSHKLHKETNQKLQNELESLQAKEAQTRESKEILKSKLSQLQETHTQATQGLHTLQVKLSETEANYKEVLEAKEALVQQVQAELTSAQVIKDELEKLSTEKTAIEEQSAKEIAQLQSHLEGKKTLETELSALKEADIQKAQQLQTIQTKLHESEAKSQKVLEAKETLSQQLATLTEEKENYAQSRNAWKVRVEKAETTLSETEEKNKELVETKESLVQQLSELNQRAETLKTERDSARKERDECKTVHNELKINFEQKVKQLAERQERTNELQKKMQDTEAANENYKQRQTMLDDELKKAEMQIEIIKDLLLSGSK